MKCVFITAMVTYTITIQAVPCFYDKSSSYQWLFAKVLKQPDQHVAFTIRDQLIWSRNRGGEQVLCVPSMKMGSQSLHGIIIDQVHMIVGHFGPQHTTDYVWWWYWWPWIHHKVQKFCNLCQVCLKAKENGWPLWGLLHSLPIPTQPWQLIGMDFVGPFLEIDGYNYLWVVICHMINMVHLIPVNTKMTALQLGWASTLAPFLTAVLMEATVWDTEDKELLREVVEDWSVMVIFFNMRKNDSGGRDDAYPKFFYTFAGPLVNGHLNLDCCHQQWVNDSSECLECWLVLDLQMCVLG